MNESQTLESAVSIETLGSARIKSPPSLSNPHVSWLSWQRALGIAFAVVTQLVFFWTALSLFFFLRDGSSIAGNAFVANVLLAVFFAWPHSLLLVPSIQKRLKQHIPAGLIGCVHCLATCISLLVLFAFWTRTSGSLWVLTGSGAVLMQVGFYASWLGLFYSLYWTGLGYQTGATQAWYWFRQLPPPIRKFEGRGAFRYMRHPVYLSFLGLIWFTPIMTWDHVVLTFIWTLYIFLGSYFKDRRMMHYLGNAYREYASRVPGYPLIGFGPMGRLPLELSTEMVPTNPGPLRP